MKILYREIHLGLNPSTSLRTRELVIKLKRITLTLGRTRVKCVVTALHPTPRIFLQFFQEDFLRAPAIFNSCTADVAVHAYHIRHILAK